MNTNRPAMNLWHRIQAAVTGGMRQQITRSGIAFTLASVVVGVAAFASANNLLFLLFAATLATMLISGFVSRLSLAGLALDFVLPDHVPARRKVAARLRVRNEKSWIPSFSIEVSGAAASVFSTAVYFPAIPARGALEETIEVYFARRGRHREDTFQFTTRFPFGFTQRHAQVALPREILVYPCIDPQPGFEELLHSLAGEMEARHRGRGYDFYRIRPYEFLESARHVDWKATAHTGDLQVREFAREQDPLVEVFLDLEAPAALAIWFEQAVDCCAFLVWRLSRMGARVRLRTQTFDLCLPAEGDVYTMLKYLALVSARSVKPPIGPPDDNSFAIVLSAAPRRFQEQGWEGARVLGPDSFHGVGADLAAAGAGEDVDHRR